MMGDSTFMWMPAARHLAELLDVGMLRERTRVAPPPVADLSRLAPGVAAESLDAALGEAYVPTESGLAVMRELLEVMIGHYVQRYRDELSTRQGLYAPVQEPEAAPKILCLTGLAGTGKSRLLAALQRAMQGLPALEIGAGHAALDIEGLWRVTIGARADLVSPLYPLVALTGEAVPKRFPASRLRERLIPRAYSRGIALLAADEFQFLTQSSSANALATRLILFLGTLGIPFCFAANYSLCHRLSSRPQEDRDRVLSRPIILDPPNADGSDWHALIEEYVRISAGQLDLDPVAHGAALHRFCAGHPRGFRRLCRVGYRLAREDGCSSASYRHFERAYRSTEYSKARRDVELLMVQSIANQKQREDLWCPFERPPTETTTHKAEADAQYQGEVAQSRLRSALTPDERAGVAEVEAVRGRAKLGGRVAKVVRTKRKPPTKEELIAAGSALLARRAKSKSG